MDHVQTAALDLSSHILRCGCSALESHYPFHFIRGNYSLLFAIHESLGHSLFVNSNKTRPPWFHKGRRRESVCTPLGRSWVEQWAKTEAALMGQIRITTNVRYEGIKGKIARLICESFRAPTYLINLSLTGIIFSNSCLIVTRNFWRFQLDFRLVQRL